MADREICITLSEHEQQLVAQFRRELDRISEKGAWDAIPDRELFMLAARGYMAEFIRPSKAASEGSVQ